MLLLTTLRRILLAAAGRRGSLSFTTQPVAVVSGATMTAFVVKKLRPNGTVDHSFRGNITVAPTSTGGGALAAGGTLTVAAVAGVATFSAATMTLSAVPSGISGDPVAGYEFTLTATATGLTSAVSSAFGVTWTPENIASETVLVTAKEGVTTVAGTMTIVSAATAMAAGDTIRFTRASPALDVTLTATAGAPGTLEFQVSATAATQAGNIAAAINAAAGLSGILTASAPSATCTLTRGETTADNGITLAVVDTNAALTLGGNNYFASTGKLYNATSQAVDTVGSVAFVQGTAANRRSYVENNGSPYFLATGQQKLQPASAHVLNSFHNSHAGHVWCIVNFDDYDAAAAVEQRLFWTGVTNGNVGINLSYDNTAGTNKITFVIFNGTSNIQLIANDAIDSDGFVLIVVSVTSAAAGGGKLYKNGTLLDNTWTNAGTDDVAGDASTTLSLGDATTRFHRGGLAAFGGGSAALTDGELALLGAWADAEFPGLSLP